MSSMSYGGESVVEPDTMQGRDWPALRQLGVFLENRVGRLNELLRVLEREDSRVCALSILDTIDCVIVRIIMSEYERALEILRLSGQTFFETDVIGVELPDDPQPFSRICQALLQAEVNIHYSYPLLLRRNGRHAIAIFVDDIDLGIRALSEQGHRIITEKDLREDDEYF